ncbi:hypothetical protein R1flu_023200 [Riccia fluitans]|uniref:Uncharacterized protein n=1 Tax=Riccia fluitans TaxID=41844 RepID=A0ABD1XS39_9MARC
MAGGITTGVLALWTLISTLMLVTQMPVTSARSSTVFQTSVNELRHAQREHRGFHAHARTHSRKLSSLVVESNSLLLSYHNGPILAGTPAINVYIVWYGRFSASQKATIVDFFGSLGEGVAAVEDEPSVRSWWKLTESYTDSRGSPVASQVILKGQTSYDSYSMGKTLSNEDIQRIVLESFSDSTDSSGIYFVLTSEDVQVGSFCMNSCGSHHFSLPSRGTNYRQLLFAWVGNSASLCAGRCAWPFAKPQYGPPMTPLAAPNGDVGVDGMIINIAALLAGTATNPYSNGYFQGDASAPLESASSCSGVYGEGAFPGYPGALIVDEATGGSYNAMGVNGRRFLLPALWDPATRSCRVSSPAAVDVALVDRESGSYSQ